MRQRFWLRLPIDKNAEQSLTQTYKQASMRKLGKTGMMELTDVYRNMEEYVFSIFY
jgi:hypothetical protein